MRYNRKPWTELSSREPRRYHTKVQTRDLSCPDAPLVELSHRSTQHCKWRGHKTERAERTKAGPDQHCCNQQLTNFVSLHVHLKRMENLTEQLHFC